MVFLSDLLLVVNFEIYRYNPSKEPHQHPYVQTFKINVDQCGPMVLDALIKIKSEQDPSLTFRRYLQFLTSSPNFCEDPAVKVFVEVAP